MRRSINTENWARLFLGDRVDKDGVPKVVQRIDYRNLGFEVNLFNGVVVFVEPRNMSPVVDAALRDGKAWEPRENGENGRVARILSMDFIELMFSEADRFVERNPFLVVNNALQTFANQARSPLALLPKEDH